MATRRERRLGHADQDNRRNQNPKNFKQAGFFHLNSSAAPSYILFDDTPGSPVAQNFQITRFLPAGGSNGLPKRLETREAKVSSSTPSAGGLTMKDRSKRPSQLPESLHCRRRRNPEGKLSHSLSQIGMQFSA
jgi:hypothetical protein